MVRLSMNVKNPGFKMDDTTSILEQNPTGRVQDESDRWHSEGARNLSIDIADLYLSTAMHNPGIPVGFWRSVGISQNPQTTGCPSDELACQAG